MLGAANKLRVCCQYMYELLERQKLFSKKNMSPTLARLVRGSVSQNKSSVVLSTMKFHAVHTRTPRQDRQPAWYSTYYHILCFVQVKQLKGGVSSRVLNPPQNPRFDFTVVWVLSHDISSLLKVPRSPLDERINKSRLLARRGPTSV